MSDVFMANGKPIVRSGERPTHIHIYHAKDHGSNSYRQPDSLNTSIEGKKATIKLADGKTIDGTVRYVGQYFIEVGPFFYDNLSMNGETVLVKNFETT